MSRVPSVHKDVTLSSLYFPEADKQPNSTGQLWYTAWCPLLQVRGREGGEGREEGGEEGYEFVSMYMHARVCACVRVCVYRFEGQVLILWMVWFVVCTSVFVLVVAISPLPLL